MWRWWEECEKKECIQCLFFKLFSCFLRGRTEDDIHGNLKKKWNREWNELPARKENKIKNTTFFTTCFYFSFLTVYLHSEKKIPVLLVQTSFSFFSLSHVVCRHPPRVPFACDFFFRQFSQLLHCSAVATCVACVACASRLQKEEVGDLCRLLVYADCLRLFTATDARGCEFWDMPSLLISYMEVCKKRLKKEREDGKRIHELGVVGAAHQTCSRIPRVLCTSNTLFLFCFRSTVFFFFLRRRSFSFLFLFLFEVRGER